MAVNPIKVWNGTAWEYTGPVVAAPPVKYQATAPTSPATGDVWVESDYDVASVDPSKLLTGGVYTNESTRSAAIPTPTEGMLTYRSDIDNLELYNGSTWVQASGLRTEQTYALTTSSGISVTGLVVGGRYRINGVLTSTSSPIINFRWRENSTDKATNYLWMQTGTNLAGSVLGFAGNPGTEHYVGNCFANAFTMFSHDLTVCSATTGEIIGQFYDSANGRNITTSSVNSNMSNLNGFSIFPSTGTITGNITIYRYA